MSGLETAVPLFDILTNHEIPYGSFGDVLVSSAERDRDLFVAAEKAIARIEEGFGVHLAKILDGVPSELDRIVHDMWVQGWNPDEGDVNLFATDFGLALVKAITSLVGGVLVFRSESDLSHFSLWWHNKKLEAFPFHKTLKCLQSPDGESVNSFVVGLRRLLSSDL